MPRLEDTEQALLDAGQDAKQRAKSAWDGFSDFALRDNVLEVAVGLMYIFLFANIASTNYSSAVYTCCGQNER